MIRNGSIKKQFIVNFIFIILFSIVLSLLTYGGYMTLFSKGIIRPSNYYEQKIPAVRNYIEERGSLLLNTKEKEELEKHIPLEGIGYAVFNEKDSKLYGNTSIEIGEEEKIKGSVIRGQRITLYIPLKEKEYEKGTIALRYYLKPTAVNPKYNYLIPPDVVIFLMPFVYIIFFTLLFAKKFSSNLNKPISDLVNAAKKVKNKELDFNINYRADNELGELSQAFEDMREELYISLNKQWKIEEEREEMVSAIAHDLRTPLTIIKGHIEVLEDSGFDNRERTKRYLSTISENTNRAIKLIEDMNTLTKIERAGFFLEVQSVNIVDFIKRKAEEYIILCDEKKVKFTYNIEDTASKENLFNMDSYRISQVLDNVILNSLRFTPEGGNINLYLRFYDEKIDFEVKDSGKGFSLKDITKIFNKFYQGDKSRSEEKGHSGLGLYISKLIVEKHGGEIRAGNNKEGGAYISFYISTKILK